MTRSYWLLCAALLPACTLGDRALGGCPDGEVCSDKTPEGLQFVGTAKAGDLFTSGPGPTAIGGTQEVQIEDREGNPLGLSFLADGKPAFSVAHSDANIVTVTGKLAGNSYLRILDPADDTLFDRFLMDAAPLDHVDFVSGDLFEVQTTGLSLAYLTGERNISFGLFDAAGNRLVDTSAVFQVAGATNIGWDTVHLSAHVAGTLSTPVTAGGHEQPPLDLVIVDSIEDIQTINAQSEVALGVTDVCVEGLAQGRHVVGIDEWTMTFAGNDSTSVDGCFQLTTTALGPLTVHMAAAGAEKDIQLTVVRSQGQDAPRVAKLPHGRETAGERATIAE